MSGPVSAPLQYRDGVDPRRPPPRAPSSTDSSFFAYAGATSVLGSVPQSASMDVLRNHPATLTDNAAMHLLHDADESTSGDSGALSGMVCTPGSCVRARYAYSAN